MLGHNGCKRVPLMQILEYSSNVDPDAAQLQSQHSDLPHYLRSCVLRIHMCVANAARLKGNRPLALHPPMRSLFFPCGVVDRYDAMFHGIRGL